MEGIEDQKLKDILIVGKELFWKYGFKRVTIEEVCREAKVSKMTFYKHFKNKTELVHVILDKVVGKLLDEFKDLVNSDKPFQEKIQGMFLIKRKGAEGISMEFINDLYKNPDTGLHLKMEEMGKLSLELFVMFLEDSKKKKLIRQGVNTKIILSYFNHVSMMQEDQEIISQYEKIEDFIVEAMSFCFYGILPRN